MTEQKKPVAKLVQALTMKALATVARGTEITVDGERMDAAKLSERADKELIEAGVELARAGVEDLVSRGQAAIAGARSAGAQKPPEGRFSDPRAPRRRRPRGRPRDRE